MQSYVDMLLVVYFQIEFLSGMCTKIDTMKLEHWKLQKPFEQEA